METAIIIQARLGSTRLPGKVLKKINGKTILEYVINRLKKTKLSNNIIVATTNREEDKKIIKVAKKSNCHTFRGSTNNVLNRYYKAAVHYKVKNIVRITSDCPLIDPKIVNKVYFFYLKNNYDYVSNRIFPTYPIGMGLEILNFKSLKKANKLTKSSYDKEHVTPYLKKSSKINKGNFSLKQDYSKLRVTLDNQNDLKLIRHIAKELNPNKYFSWKKILGKLKKLQKNEIK